MWNVALAAALAMAAQDPPALRKTAEERLQELERRLAEVEKRHAAAVDENRRLEKHLADAKSARENGARRLASGWIVRFAAPAGLSPEQAAEIEEMWRAWHLEDLERSAARVEKGGFDSGSPDLLVSVGGSGEDTEGKALGGPGPQARRGGGG